MEAVDIELLKDLGVGRIYGREVEFDAGVEETVDITLLLVKGGA